MRLRNRVKENIEIEIEPVAGTQREQSLQTVYRERREGTQRERERESHGERRRRRRESRRRRKEEQKGGRRETE